MKTSLVFSVSRPDNLLDNQILLSVLELDNKGFCIKFFDWVNLFESETKLWLLQKFLVNHLCCFAILLRLCVRVSVKIGSFWNESSLEYKFPRVVDNVRELEKLGSNLVLNT